MKLNPFFLFFILFISIVQVKCEAQGQSSRWTMGYGNGSVGWGGCDINFISGNPDTSYVLRSVNFGRTSDNVCDRNGNFLFCTNGYSVGDASNSFMQNGDSLFPFDPGDFIYGEDVPQACIILPDPSDSMKYYIFNEFPDLYVLSASGAGLYATNLYYAQVDMRLNGGFGAVTSKFNILLSDTLAEGQITACRHANGRDWWLVIPECGNNGYYMYLISPAGIQLVSQEHIGVRDYLSGEGAFSPDGSRYAYYNWYSGLEIFDFDRCNGSFSNPVFIPNIDTVNQSGWGLAFSPDSKKIYVCSNIVLYQFNLDAGNIASSQQTVGVWDGFYDGVPFATAFGMLKLAIDGKIYITTGSGTHYLHRIEFPDSLGMACHLQQRYVQLPTWEFNSIPNHPNYNLGSIDGSVCDTVLTAGSVKAENNLRLCVSPNPAESQFTISYETLTRPTTLRIINFEGKEIVTSLPVGSTQTHLNLPELHSGIYLIKLENDSESSGIKLVLY